LSLRPKQWVADLEACYHGGMGYAELKHLGINPDEVLDFSVCLNPFMPPPQLKKALGDVAIGQYPDSEATGLKERLSAELSVPEENILVGSGTTELIRLIALAYLREDDRVLIPEPTYGEYELASRMVGAQVVKHRLRVADNFALRMEEVAWLMRGHCPRAVFICNPNNPTGRYLSQPDILTLVDAIGDGLLIIDEAYVAFVEASWPSTSLISRDNVVILRSMTKDYVLAGLRLGYAVAHREIIANLRRVCPPWNVNIVAQKMGALVLEDRSSLEQSKGRIKEAKEFLVKELSRLGFAPLPSDTHFFLVEVGEAGKFRNALLERGIIVRDCTSFGLPEYVRIAARTMPECQRLVAAIEGICRTK